MIELLRGTLAAKNPGHVIVDVGGVGYGADVPLTTSSLLPPVGEGVVLHTYLYVQESILRLYGFLTVQEREIFEVFLGTSGIGPKTALGILSSIEIDAFAQAILRGDLAKLVKIPGIGKKTAERLILELREKMAVFAAAVPAGSGRIMSNSARPAALADTMAALEALGCKPPVAERAALAAWEILGPAAGVEELLKEGLKHRNR